MIVNGIDVVKYPVVLRALAINCYLRVSHTKYEIHMWRGAYC